MKKKPVITKARYAGENDLGVRHRVVTIEGGNGAYRREPCGTCPWRKDAVGEFPAEAFRISASTSYDGAMNQFSCHSSGAKKPATCAGFLLRGADDNIGARISQIRGQLDMSEVSDGGHALFDSYFAMAVANGVAPDDPVLERCAVKDSGHGKRRLKAR